MLPTMVLLVNVTTSLVYKTFEAWSVAVGLKLVYMLYTMQACIIHWLYTVIMHNCEIRLKFIGITLIVVYINISLVDHAVVLAVFNLLRCGTSYMYNSCVHMCVHIY